MNELVDQLVTARDENYITAAELQEGRMLTNKALALLNGYINYLRKAKKTITKQDSADNA